MVTRGAPHTLEQIQAQLGKVISVRKVRDVSADPMAVQRELALIKVKGSGQQRVEALSLADIFRAKVIDTSHVSFVFELTGAGDKIDAFCALMQPIGLAEVSRTGVVAILRGPSGLS